MDRRKLNTSGYYDMTAYLAIENVSREENRSKRKLNKLLRLIFKECSKAGFEVQGRIVLKDIETGRIWR